LERKIIKPNSQEKLFVNKTRLILSRPTRELRICQGTTVRNSRLWLK
jgi:hypothetical protein